MRRGRLFRSDVLYRLTESDILTLQSLGINTVIDLRSRDEVRRYPQNLDLLVSPRHFNVPILSDTYSETGNMTEDYLLLLHNAGGGFREIFDLLAEGQHPSFINCFAGWDRTGLTSALILGALGVPNDVIVADYALSEQHMFRHMHIHRPTDDASAAPELLPTWLRAAPATMEATLQAIADEWGSVRGYLETIGVPIQDLRHINDALVEHVSAHQPTP